MSVNFWVRLCKENLVFSAAHFITFAGNTCERLHGHNYRVAAYQRTPSDCRTAADECAGTHHRTAANGCAKRCGQYARLRC